MQHIQIVEFDTSRPVNDVRDAMHEWLQASRGKRVLQMAVLAAERDRPNHYWEVLEFASQEEAAKSSELPETKSALQRWYSLLDGEPVYHNLDVLEQVGGGTNVPVDIAAGATPGAG